MNSLIFRSLCVDTVEHDPKTFDRRNNSSVEPVQESRSNNLRKFVHIVLLKSVHLVHFLPVFEHIIAVLYSHLVVHMSVLHICTKPV